MTPPPQICHFCMRIILKAVKVQWIRKTFISPSTISNNLDRGPGSEELSHRDNFIKKKKKLL